MSAGLLGNQLETEAIKMTDAARSRGHRSRTMDEAARV